MEWPIWRRTTVTGGDTHRRSVAPIAGKLPPLETLPSLTAGLLATFIWILISSVFFYYFSFSDRGELNDSTLYIRENWTYLDAIYFTIISLFTIGQSTVVFLVFCFLGWHPFTAPSSETEVFNTTFRWCKFFLNILILKKWSFSRLIFYFLQLIETFCDLYFVVFLTKNFFFFLLSAYERKVH